MNFVSSMLIPFISCLQEEEVLPYDAMKSIACATDMDSVNDKVYDEVDTIFTGFLDYVGVGSKWIHDIVGGNNRHSANALNAIKKAFKDAYNDKDIYNIVDEFSKKFEIDTTTLDGAGSPPACRSGYKRKLIIQDGKTKWKCVRLFGKTVLSANQKKALRKAQAKAHTSKAEYARSKSNKVRRARGL